MNNKLLLTLVVLTISTNCNGQEISQKNSDSKALTSLYFDQEPPGQNPELFAPGIISIEGFMVHDSPVFSPDGNEIYWSEFTENPNHTSIKYSKKVNTSWTEPELVSFSSLNSYGDGCPFMLANGKILYFNSFRELKKGDNSDRERIWYVEKQGNKWGDPQPVGEEINKLDLHWQISLSANRNLYFSTDQGIMRSQYVNGTHQKPEEITTIMNSKYIGILPFIAQDESYIIFSSDQLPNCLGKKDLYIGYRKMDGTWTDPIHLGNTINSSNHDLCPIITFDGKFLLYVSWRQIDAGVYWAPADFIEKLKPDDIHSEGLLNND